MIDLPMNSDGTIKEPRMRLRPYPLPPRRRWLWFGPRDQGSRNASNYPCYGVVYTEYTDPWVLEQEKAEYWLYTKNPLNLIRALSRDYRKRVELWSHGIEAAAYVRTLGHLAPSARLLLTQFHVKLDSRILANHYNLGITEAEAYVHLWSIAIKELEGMG